MRIWPLLASLGLAAGCVMLLVREATEWQQRAIEEDRARSEAAEARLRCVGAGGARVGGWVIMCVARAGDIDMQQCSWCWRHAERIEAHDVWMQWMRWSL